MDKFDEYNDFCERAGVPLFARPYWLEAVCPGQWDVILVRRGGRAVAALPYHCVRRFGLKFMLQPRLTQFLGLQIDFTEAGATDYSRRSFFRQCAADAIAQISSLGFAYIQMAMHHSYTDWLPFHWAGYSSTTRYTYVIPDISSPDEVAKSFHASKRRHLKAAAAAGLTADSTMTAGEFYAMHSRCLAAKGQKPSYPAETLARIASIMGERGQCAFIAVRGNDRAAQSAAFVVWDDSTAYQLLSCTDTASASTGASSFAVKSAIDYCSDKSKAYDFEGSMMRDVEFSYSKCGTEQRPYLYLEKYSSFAMEIALRLAGKT